jgi:hypothetical protein
LGASRAAAQDLSALEHRLRYVAAAGDAADVIRSLRSLVGEHERRITWGA